MVFLCCRDYTDKMRTINAFECWPFEMKEDLTQEKINSMLPPMSIPNNSSRFLSQNDVLRRRSPQHSEQRNSIKTIPDANNVASASKEKLLSRSKLRRRSIAEIFDQKKDVEKPQPSQSLMAMSLPLPMSTTPNYLFTPPSPPQPMKDLHRPPSSSFQIGNLLNVIVLEDNEEEDEQMVSKFRRSKRLETLRSEPESLNKILTMASETNDAGDREDEMENEVHVKVKEFTTTKVWIAFNYFLILFFRVITFRNCNEGMNFFLILFSGIHFFLPFFNIYL